MASEKKKESPNTPPSHSKHDPPPTESTRRPTLWTSGDLMRNHRPGGNAIENHRFLVVGKRDYNLVCQSLAVNHGHLIAIHGIVRKFV